MDRISEDLSLIQNAAKIAKYPVLGMTKSTDDSGVIIDRCGVLIRTGGDTCASWNPITSEKDLFNWLNDIGFNPFHHGFVIPICAGFSIGVPEGYEPKLGPFEDKEAHSRNIVSTFVGVLPNTSK